MYQQISRQIRLKIICKVCQIASYIATGAFYCFPAGDLFWDFAISGLRWYTSDRYGLVITVGGVGCDSGDLSQTGLRGTCV